MTLLGTALRPAATRVMLLGSGELGKEVAIECQRLGVEVIAVDRYPDALCIEPQTDAPNATSGPCAMTGEGAPVVMTTTWRGTKLSRNP